MNKYVVKNNTKKNIKIYLAKQIMISQCLDLKVLYSF